MSFETAESKRIKEKRKFELKQEKIIKGKAKKENIKDWRLGAFSPCCRR